MRAWLQSHPIFLSALWLTAVPWLLFPTIVPILTAVSLVLLLLLLFRSQQLPRLSLPATPLNPYLMLFLLLVGVAYLASPLPQVSLPKLTVIILGVITFYLLFSRLDCPKAIDQLVAVLAVCAGLVALMGFFTLEWPERQVVDLQPITDRLPHLGGSFAINYNEMAGTLLIFFPFVLAAMRKGNGRFKNAVFLFHLIILITLLFFTQSRGAIAGLLVIILTWFLWGRISLRKMLPIFIITGLALLLVMLVVGFSPDDLFNWLAVIDAGSKQGDVPPTSWLTRVEIWEVAGNMLADYPVIGAGLYTFDPVSRANYVYESILPSFNLTHAHNLLLQTGSSLGIGGLLALAGIWATTLVGLWRAGRSEDERIRRLSAAFAASIVGYLFFNLFDTITFGQKPGLFAWVVLAGSVSLSQLAVEQPVTAHLPILAVGRAAALAPFLALLILLLSPALPRNLNNLRLDRAYLGPEKGLAVSSADFPKDVRRAGLERYLAADIDGALSFWRRDPQGTAFLQSQGTIAFMSDNIALAISWYDLALELTPNSAETYLWRAIANEERGMAALAEADFRRAARYTAVSDASNSTKAYIHYRLGDLLAEKGEWQAAAEAFAQATTYEPDEAWYYRELGDALTALGDEAGAAAAYQKANQ